jgi:hypothetical protein
MKLLNFSKHSLLILAVSAIAFQSCKKDAATELADTFVAKYTGTYRSGGTTNFFTQDNAPVVITKKSATEVAIDLSLFGVSVVMKGTAKNDTLVEIPAQPYGKFQIPTAGTCVVKNGVITMKYTSKDPASTTVNPESYVGKKL